MRHGHERRPVKIGVLMVPDVERREIDENGAEEGHGDAYRADGDVLPRGFERSTCSAVPDKEGGDDRCSLDCYPHDPHVSGHHGEEHGGHESLDQHAVERCVTAMLLAVVAGNVGVMWVAVEATTIITTFLVGHRRTRGSLEASWKYIAI